jgi:hypothetical protein
MEALPPVAAEPPTLPIEDPKRLDILIGHYDKTSELVQSARTQRDRLFLWLLVILVVEFFSSVHPRATQALALAALKWLTRGSSDEVAAQVDFGVVNLFVYTLWLYLLLHYYQGADYVRTYLRYLGRLEDQIAAFIGPGLFIREGAFYLAHRGRLHTSTRFFYEWLFHGILLSVLLFRLWSERPAGASALPLLLYGGQLILSVAIGYYAVQHLLDLVTPRLPGELAAPVPPRLLALDAERYAPTPGAD